MNTMPRETVVFSEDKLPKCAAMCTKAYPEKTPIFLPMRVYQFRYIRHNLYYLIKFATTQKSISDIILKKETFNKHFIILKEQKGS
jgi:hypothetical protein